MSVSTYVRSKLLGALTATFGAAPDTAWVIDLALRHRGPVTLHVVESVAVLTLNQLVSRPHIKVPVHHRQSA